MPWDVKQTARCPASKPWGVIGGASGDRLAGCHPTQAAARAQQQALYAAESRGKIHPVEDLLKVDPESGQDLKVTPEGGDREVPVAYSLPATIAW